ncbi:MAG TPA: Grx4 family monothiol glutaredoxin [Gammaproteobacteria bacterium]|nr:Grx4 family monothiol glutaredoxin [Gammaproteobacteria bacterium]
METLDLIKQQIANNSVILYMKGTPQFPMCGFSSRVVQILKTIKAKFSYVNVLESPDIRLELPKYAQWPTFPQLYINGELIGGCDIVTDLQEKNELLPMFEAASAIGSDKAEFIAA